MKIRAGTHLFGSVTGYTTLARSPDVTADEAAELSVLGFGQSSDPVFLQRLRHTPTAYGRRLRSGRFAITRCFPGPPDDAGRATLRLCSLLLDIGDYHRICRGDGLEQIVSGEHWGPAGIAPVSAGEEPFEQGWTVNLTVAHLAARAVDETLLSAFDAWMAASQRPGAIAVMPASEQWNRAVLGLPAALSDAERAEYRWGVQLLGTGAPADVCTLSPGASRSGRRPTIPCQPGRWRSAGVGFLAGIIAEREMHELPPRRSVRSEPAATAAGAPVSTEARGGDVHPPHAPHPRHRRRFATLASLAIVLIAGLSIGLGVAAYRMIGSPAGDQYAADRPAESREPAPDPTALPEPRPAAGHGGEAVPGQADPPQPEPADVDADVSVDEEPEIGAPPRQPPDTEPAEEQPPEPAEKTPDSPEQPSEPQNETGQPEEDDLADDEPPSDEGEESEAEEPRTDPEGAPWRPGRRAVVRDPDVPDDVAEEDDLEDEEEEPDPLQEALERIEKGLPGEEEYSYEYATKHLQPFLTDVRRVDKELQDVCEKIREKHGDDVGDLLPKRRKLERSFKEANRQLHRTVDELLAWLVETTKTDGLRRPVDLYVDVDTARKQLGRIEQVREAVKVCQDALGYLNSAQTRKRWEPESGESAPGPVATLVKKARDLRGRLDEIVEPLKRRITRLKQEENQDAESDD